MQVFVILKELIMKRLLSFFIVPLLIMSLMATYVAAGYTHGHTSYLRYSCSGVYVCSNTVNCPFRGSSGGGVTHSNTCQIVQSLRITNVDCELCGFSHHNDADCTHVCDAYHTGANLIVHPCRGEW